MSSIITERLNLLRKQMEKHNLEICIIPTADPHQSEYTADCWKFREYLSGFTGSAGTLVVSLSDAALWTDSRYFLQAEEELKGNHIELFKIGFPDTPNPESWIIEKGYHSVGLDGSVFSMKNVLKISRLLAQNNIRIETDFTPYNLVWPDRPTFPEGEIYVFPEDYCGEPVQSKLKRLRIKMEELGSDCIPLTALDEIAWLFNLRGSDIDYNPVGICYAFIDKRQSILFADSSKLKSKTTAYLKANNIEIEDYDNFSAFLEKHCGSKVLLDESKINYQLYKSIPKSCTIVKGISPVTLMKSIKNEIEIAGFRKAMIYDGVALVRFWRWLEKSVNKDGEPQNNSFPDEWTIGKQIAAFRKEQKNYICESFCPIVGYNEHGAIVHYEATPGGAFQVKPNGFLLIDTGGQYLDGTTDITRSWSFYRETPQNYKEDYTCLLKGQIALSSAIFPKGTRGSQLDILARQFMWKRHLNFWHGTGHGIGHFLNVHEGPQSIRMNESPVSLEPGMVTSNEPGLYRANQYGIRLENLILVCENEESDFGKYLSFETLTLLPYDLNSIDNNLLNREEKEWINNYHQNVYVKLSPFLNNDERLWLKAKTKRIK